MDFMTRFLLKHSLVLVAAFAVFNVAARAIGTLQPPNPALAGFIEGCEGKPQPCWYGIVPGVTTDEDVTRIMLQQGYTEIDDYGSDVQYESDNSVIWRVFVGYVYTDETYSDRLVGGLVLWLDRAEVEIQEVLVYSSEPEIIVFSPNDGEMLLNEHFSMYVPFGWESPSSRVYSLGVSDYLPHRPDLFNPWRGFMPFWVYCQLEPDYLACDYRMEATPPAPISTPHN